MFSDHGVCGCPLMLVIFTRTAEHRSEGLYDARSRCTTEPTVQGQFLGLGTKVFDLLLRVCVAAISCPAGISRTEFLLRYLGTANPVANAEGCDQPTLELVTT